MVHELEDLNLDSTYFPFDQHPSAMDEGERVVYETCVKVNKIAFGQILPLADARSVSRMVEYMYEQGLRADVAK